MPKVLNKHKDKIPAEAVYVGRPSKWGNPFKIGETYQGRVLTRETAISSFEDWLLYSDQGAKLLKDISELQGKDLVCFCAPLPCHADVLLRLAAVSVIVSGKQSVSRFALPDKIGNFSGQYRFLSNFYPSIVILDGESYTTVEHAYQAAKTTDPLERKIIQITQTPGLARAAGRSRVVVRSYRPDWDKVKVDVMLGLLRQKFADPKLRKQLVATYPAVLEEGNTWGDTFWGVCRGEGENMLGILLQIVRAEIIAEADTGSRLYRPDPDEEPF